MQRLSKRVAIVTGAARGIGKAIALRLAEEGARLTVVDIDFDTVGQVANQIQVGGGTALAIKTDVTIPSQVNSMVDRTVQQWGRVDILVNNAGGEAGSPNASKKKIQDLEVNDWNSLVALNLTSAYLCSKAVAKHMIKQKAGKIINLSSKAGRYEGDVAATAYCAAKAGVLGFTRQLAQELGPYGINVNAIAPGFTLTELLKSGWDGDDRAEYRKWVLTAISLGRVGKVEEQAAVVAFLASDEASYITGATIDVNGGWYMS